MGSLRTVILSFFNPEIAKNYFCISVIPDILVIFVAELTIN